VTEELALELEAHFIDASKALKCAHRKLERTGRFEITCKAVECAYLDVDVAARQFRNWIINNH